MKDVQIFNFETNTKIRAVLRDGEPWFVAQDVCDAIGIVNPTMALKAVDNDEKAALSLTEVSSNGVQQRREFNIINESGLYTIVLRSRKATTPGTPQHRFRKWVTSEVLPQIRKTGKYETPSDRMTDEQVGYIYNSVMRICGETGKTYQALFGMLKREFQVASYKHIKAVDFPHACEVLGVPVPVFTSRAQQAIEHQEHYGYLNEIDAWNTINLWFRLKNLSEFMQDHMLPVLKKLDSGLCGRAYSLTHDPIMTLTLTEDCLLDLSKQFQQLDNKGMDWNERVSNIKNCTFKRLT